MASMKAAMATMEPTTMVEMMEPTTMVEMVEPTGHENPTTDKVWPPIEPGLPIVGIGVPVQ